MDGPNSDDSDDDLDSGLTSEAEVKELTVGLNLVLYDFIKFLLEGFSLKRSAESMELTVQGPMF
jgi:hypothetical protein